MKRLLACLLCACACAATASAHVLDQYLQVAQIALAPDGVRVELRLIPGVQVAERIFALIDADGDGQITNTEEQAYARRVSQDVTLSLDGRNTPLTLTDQQFPTQREMREGLGTIRFTFTAATRIGGAGQQQLYFRNNHQPEFSSYLANALVPATKEIKITGQERDALQRELRIHFHATADAAHGRLRWPGVLVLCLCLALLLPQWRRLRQARTV